VKGDNTWKRHGDEWRWREYRVFQVNTKDYGKTWYLHDALDNATPHRALHEAKLYALKLELAKPRKFDAFNTEMTAKRRLAREGTGQK
jgi:hypothetical protein